jgi:hypothetical protein
MSTMVGRAEGSAPRPACNPTGMMGCPSLSDGLPPSMLSLRPSASRPLVQAADLLASKSRFSASGAVACELATFGTRLDLYAGILPDPATPVTTLSITSRHCITVPRWGFLDRKGRQGRTQWG